MPSTETGDTDDACRPAAPPLSAAVRSEPRAALRFGPPPSARPDLRTAVLSLFEIRKRYLFFVLIY